MTSGLVEEEKGLTDSELDRCRTKRQWRRWPGKFRVRLGRADAEILPEAVVGGGGGGGGGREGIKDRTLRLRADRGKLEAGKGVNTVLFPVCGGTTCFSTCLYLSSR